MYVGTVYIHMYSICTSSLLTEIISIIALHRNPSHHQRPTFEKIYNSLVTMTTKHLQMVGADGVSNSSLSAVLGAPLKHSKDLYMDLQETYITEYI